MRLVPVVEGHGEVEAVPVLIRRMAEALGYPVPRVERPIRQPRKKIVQTGELERVVRLAVSKLEGNPGAVFILLDAETDCPASLGPELADRAGRVAGEVPVAVVLAKQEYEAWFLASLESLRGERGIRPDCDVPADPESVSGAKEYLERCMPTGRAYSETVDQAKLTARMDLEVTRSRSPSFAKCWREIERVLREIAGRSAD